MRVIVWVFSIVGELVVLFIIGSMCLKWRRGQICKAPPEQNPRIVLPEVGESGTLNTDQHGGIVSPESIANIHGQEQSVGTTDPNYPGTVSSDGGTLQSRFSGDNTFGTQSIYTNENDNQSFQKYLRSASDQAHSRQDIFSLTTPAGRVGFVIDTPNSGAPVIHSIEEDCPIVEWLLVGDHIVAVDDENVMDYTAVKISRMISHRSAKPKRKFTIVRNIVD